MKLLDAIAKLSPTTNISSQIPAYLYGAFRRKSISFSNGLTDEKTIVYWFQSRSFTIDLRLNAHDFTPIQDRQGWIGQTLWDERSKLLSWEVKEYANYQNHLQWPEPAKLHAIGNCLLEFSPSNAYVEDWRQQVHSGLYIGLRLQSARDKHSGEILQMDGGIIICDNHIAFARSRLPEQQARVKQLDFGQFNQFSDQDQSDIESFEVSIGTTLDQKAYTTHPKTPNTQRGLNTNELNTFELNHFEVLDQSTLSQSTVLEGRHIEMIYGVDIYRPEFHFSQSTETTQDAKDWLIAEQAHLMQHTQAVY